MKEILSLVFSGIIGGMIVFGGMQIMDQKEQIVDSNEDEAKTYLTSSNITIPSAYPLNFVDASSVAVPAVVHITAAESEQLAQQRMQDRRGNRGDDFFGFRMEDFFGGDFFGPNMFGPKVGTGSGVIISEDGYIVTNNHVVGKADDIKVVLSDDREFKAKLVGTDPSSDLAVIKIEANNLATIPYGDSDVAKVGEWVLAVGNPFNYLESTVTAGIISAKGRDLDIIEADRTIEEFIQTDAAVNPGNSGGALVDAQGNLIGINTAIATPTGVYAGYSFAIPINLAKNIIKDIIENGNIERANLGILGYDINEEIARDFKLDIDKGIYVSEVAQGSGAQFSGILPGDVVVGANSRKVDNFDDIKRIMQLSKVGDTITLEILRNGEKMTIPVKIKKRA